MTPATSRRSPSAVPDDRRITPPVSICTAASANGLGGTGSRVVAKVPVGPAQARPAAPATAPTTWCPARRRNAGPASTSTASPTHPTPTPAIVAAPRPVAGQRAQEHDPQRNRGDQQRGQPGRHALLGEHDHARCPTPAAAGPRARWCRTAPASSGTPRARRRRARSRPAGRRRPGTGSRRPAAAARTGARSGWPGRSSPRGRRPRRAPPAGRSRAEPGRRRHPRDVAMATHESPRCRGARLRYP